MLKKLFRLKDTTATNKLAPQYMKYIIHKDWLRIKNRDIDDCVEELMANIVLRYRRTYRATIFKRKDTYEIEFTHDSR